MKNFMPAKGGFASGEKKLIIIPILFFTIFLSGCVNSKTASSDPGPSASKPSSSQVTFSPISDSRDGVDVTVEGIRKENGKTIIELVLNNHRYDLADMDAKNMSSFSEVKPSEYNIISSAMGGHHVEAEMVFDQELSGPLTIGLDDSLVFNFNIQ